MRARQVNGFHEALVAPPLSLYVHLPWCVRKCPYCDFNSHPQRGTLPETAYMEALLADLAAELERSAPRPLVSVFFGGGTPSLFSAESIARVIDALDTRLVEDAEVTLEANPGALEHGRFAELRRAGVNRLSIGVQSFAPDKLAALGRIHSADDARDAFAEARAAGFEQINIDLMFGLPGQRVEEALADLEAGLALAPQHLSHYQLTIEPDTVFARHPPRLPEPDLCYEMQTQCHAALADAGFGHYEISAFARPGAECRHNLNYWRFGDYLGVGAGAHGKLTTAAGIRRSRRLRSPRAYMQARDQAQRTVAVETLSPRVAAFEYLLNALRLPEGFALRDLRRRSGADPAILEPAFAEALQLGLLTHPEPGLYRPSPRGLRFLNDLQALFLP